MEARRSIMNVFKCCGVPKIAPILYTTDSSLCPPTNAVIMLANIIGLQLDLLILDFTTMCHRSPEYLQMNPLGTVPTLEDGDLILSDSHAIMKYLLSKYAPEKKESLYPSEARAQALVDQALFFDASVFFPQVRLIAFPSLFDYGTHGSTPQRLKGIDECYSVIEAYLQTRRYMAADHVTIADLAVAATANAIQLVHKMDAEKFPRAVDWLSRLRKEPFFKNII